MCALKTDSSSTCISSAASLEIKINCKYFYFISESCFPIEVCPTGQDRENPLRVSKRLLRAWFDKSAIDECWQALFTINLDERDDTDPSMPSLPSANLKRIFDVVRILHACNPKSRMGSIKLTSARRILRSQRAAARARMKSRSDRKGGSHSQQRPSSSQSVQLQQTIRLIDELQSRRVRSLVTLSVLAVRDAIAGPIELHLHSLLAGQPSQQQHILRQQIQLDEILCENALDGFEEAFASAEALQSKLTKIVSSAIGRQFYPVEDYFLRDNGQDSFNDDDDPQPPSANVTPF